MTQPLTLQDHVAAHLGDIELRLGELDAALASGDVDRIELQAQALQFGLNQAASAFRQAHAEAVTLSAALLHRLALARTRCVQQQQSVQRVSASLGRTLGTLFPAENATYGRPGQGAATRAMNAYR
jgi:hypothetical protein